MSVRRMRSAVIVVMLASLMACGRHEDRGPEARTARAIELELERRGIDGVEVTMGDAGDSVALDGAVVSERERERAAAIVRGKFGIVEVENHLVVTHQNVPGT